ncbi:MAG TPA: hemerythrin domain-containing protein [Thermoanaerobaculia bacterium]
MRLILELLSTSREVRAGSSGSRRGSDMAATPRLSEPTPVLTGTTDQPSPPDSSDDGEKIATARAGEAIMANDPATRRDFLKLTRAAGAGLLLAGAAAPAVADVRSKERGKEEGEEVSPAEDLMREHGVLKRVLLVYGEAIRRIDAREDLPPAPLADAAKLIRSFVEDYHEKLEEDQLFPRFRRARTLVDLVDVLLQQHQAGRKLTDVTSRLANLKSLRDPNERPQLRDSMARFIRMYAPHEAREDTVLFPALRKIVKGNEYDALGEEFEKKEHQLFGEEGFEKMVDRVAGIEKAFGIYDLSQFTPKV